MGNGNGLKRRDFLTGSAAAAASFLTPTPVERLLDVLTNGLINQAQASAAGMEGPRHYLNIFMTGAPLRYSFDHWMRTNTSDPVLQFNPMVATRYVSSGGRVIGTQNSVFNYNGVLVPTFFSHSVYNSKGALRPLTDLLNHMLVIRGYGSGIDSHSFNTALNQTPVGGLSSIAGLAADTSQKSFEAVQWPNRGTPGGFFSSTGKALNLVTGTTPLHTLLAGFGAPPASRLKGRNLKQRNEEAYDLARARLKAYTKSDFAGSQLLSQNFSKAEALIKKGIGNLDGYWTTAVARYKTVIERSLRQSGLVGISDVPLISNESSMWNVHILSGNRPMTVSKDYDLRESIKTMTAPTFLAEGLAMAEYVIREGLVTSYELTIGNMDNLSLMEKETSAIVKHTAIKDMHQTGAIPGLIITAAYYRALASGILELIDQLKSVTGSQGTLWSDTVIQVMSEFSRSARSTGTGSDHGYDQMVTSVYSGAFDKGPYVVGNIQHSGVSGTYGGTQGVAAPIDGYNQKGRPSPTMAASTVAALLRVNKNPYENLAAPLVSLEGGRLRLLTDAKIIK